MNQYLEFIMFLMVSIMMFAIFFAGVLMIAG